MKEKKLYSYSALFDSPDKIIHAANVVHEKGYKKYDVHTPYPIHGMDSAMKLGTSKMAYVALVFGLLGTLGSLFMMYWMGSIDYPVIVGGKPFFSFPAYVPIMFELTVLSAAVMTVVSMLFVFFKLPNLSHPLHDTEYMKSVTADKYGVTIESVDEKYDEEEISKLYAELGAIKTFHIYYDNEEISVKHIALQPKFLGFLLFVFIFVAGSTYFTLNKFMFMQPYNWMRVQSKVTAQEGSTFFADGFGMRMPVKGTVARDKMPYLFKGEPELAAATLHNPLLPTKMNFELGKKKFNIYCSPCHGYFAKGKSRLHGQFPNPPSLHSAKVRNWPDGRIYAVIMDGQNVMPSYASQLDYNERWAVILYIKALQRSLNPKESDL